ncbi:Superfamily II DNA or RNA helicase, SNF2 family [Paenibacillaceae bacterium GAS479]|nr:Superfamily II DNA or RNA helicase, SNF2 family [Paenibacillaceae bacterium GAS479]
MSWWNRLNNAKKESAIDPVRIAVIKHEAGAEIRLFREQTSAPVLFPLELSVAELRKQPEIERLELLETLWFEEILDKQGEGYILPYEKITTAPETVLTSLGLPKPAELDLFLNHTGAVGSAHFKFDLEMQSGEWKHLERTAQFLGPWIRFPNLVWHLMSEEQYRFWQLIQQRPDPRNPNHIFSYVAHIRSEAQKLGVEMDPYLEKQEYKFVDGLEIDLNYDGKSISFNPVYTSNGDVPDALLRKMATGQSIYASDPEIGKVFVHPKTAQEAGKIQSTAPVSGQDIPKFVENPEAYLSELDGMDMEWFGERVKSLGIRVYRAQPFVHAKDKGHGWFEIDPGIAFVDETGEKVEVLSPSEFAALVNDSTQENDTDEYFQLKDEWIKKPAYTQEFLTATERLKEAFGDKSTIDMTKLPYVLEIYENIGQLEFNQPILETRQELQDKGVLDKMPPEVFVASLKPFQQEGFVWMKSLHYRNLGGLLADDMGLGKTIQVVSLLSYLYVTNKLTPVLIVVPKTLIDNWIVEINKFAPSIAAQLFVHTGNFRDKDPAILQKRGIIITTYQTLVRDQLSLGQVEWQALICDEAQAIKNPTTAASKVMKAMKAKFRLALTGTPVENSLSELWSIMDYVQPGLLGSLTEFKKEFIEKLEGEQRDPSVEQKLLTRMAMVYKRRTKSKELAGQLPPKTIIECPVPLGKVQKKLYSDIVHKVKTKQMQALQAIQKLIAICAHPALEDNQFAGLDIHDIPKLHYTIEIIREIREKGEKVLIFTHLRELQVLLRDKIRDNFDVNPNIINGMTERRQRVVDDFNSRSGFSVMILSPHAAGTGLTITSANHVIHYTRWWNPAVENQATDRVYRIGQERPVQVYYPIVSDEERVLHSGTVEQIMHRIISDKQELATSIVVSSDKLDIQNDVMENVFGVH